jgi:thioredoxin 1
VGVGVIELTGENWGREVLESSTPVLVDFWATWCPPCRAMAPIVERAAKSLAGQVKVAKLDVDRHPELAERYGIHSIPTFIVFAGGRPVAARAGAMPEAALVSLVPAERPVVA